MKKNVTVIYIITKLELGGAQKVCLNLLNGIKQANNHSFLISGTEGSLIKEIKHKKNVFLFNSFVREISPFALVKEIKTFIFLIKTIRKIKRDHPELIVHTHSTKAGLLGRWAAFFAGTKKRIHTIHGYGFNEHQSKIIWLIIYLLELITSLITTHFVCVSKKDAQTGKKLFPNFAKKYSIIHAAVDWPKSNLTKFNLTKLSLSKLNKNSSYQPAQLIRKKYQPARLEQPIIFGTISCFKKQKNLFDLLQAFERVHKKHINTRLEIIGDGILRSAIEQWIEDHNIRYAITLHGWQTAIFSIAHRWHALVMTSLWEGLPCTIIEARLMGLPVISYKTGGIPEIIKDGKNGLLYKQKDWLGIADGMNQLIENPKLYRQLQKYTDNLEMFKNQNMVSKHVQLYQNLS